MPTELHRRELDTYLALSHLRAALALLPENHPQRAAVTAVAAEMEAHWRSLEAQILAADQPTPPAPERGRKGARRS
jgi:hypothetical protein